MSSTITFLLDRDSKDYTGLTYSFKRSFERLGYICDIVAFTINLYVYKGLGYIPWVRNTYLSQAQDTILEKIKACNSEIVFVVKGYYLSPNTVAQIKELNKVVVCYNPDDPFSTAPGYSSINIRNSIGVYDAYYIWHRELLGRIKEEGCDRAYYAPFAADIELIPLLDKASLDGSAHYKYDVSFIGTANEKRANLISSLAGNLSDWKGTRAVFGKGWKNMGDFDCMTGINGNEYFLTMRKSKININILRVQNENAHNMRTFEIPASGGFMLHEYSTVAADYFKEGIEAEFYRDAAECSDKIKFYCREDGKREQIAKAGYNKVSQAGYTYDKVVEEISKNLPSHRRNLESKLDKIH